MPAVMREDLFKSIRRRAAAETKVRGSRFIAEAVPVTSDEEAESEIETVRRREYDATHHCSAYRVNPDGAVFRYRDDGEPSGTAGPPILRRIDARGLTNVLVVVTRYYGGSKLGTGGLVRAYGGVADLALNAADVVTHVMFDRVIVSFVYDDTSPAVQVIERFDAQIVASEYSDRTDLTLDVPRSRVDAFAGAFAEALGGRGTLERTG